MTEVSRGNLFNQSRFIAICQDLTMDVCRKLKVTLFWLRGLREPAEALIDTKSELWVGTVGVRLTNRAIAVQALTVGPCGFPCRAYAGRENQYSLSIIHM
jgi:hypothetical protein